MTVAAAMAVTTVAAALATVVATVVGGRHVGCDGMHRADRLCASLWSTREVGVRAQGDEADQSGCGQGFVKSRKCCCS
jgi:hypothetical protein